MRITIWANYGTLAHEKEVVYSIAPSEISEAIHVEIPDAYETVSGAIAVTVDPAPYGEPSALMLQELLGNANQRGEGGKIPDRPVLRWYDGRRYHQRDIEVLSND